MRYTHPLDRLAVAIRPVAIIVAALSFPVFLISYGLLLKHAWQTWPWWGTAATLVSHFTVVLGISSLFDSRQERLNRTQDAQS